ncbi:MAG: PadR family transcriptional regulator [Nocardioides sp.]
MKLTHSLTLVAAAILEMDMDDQGGGRLWGYALTKRSGVRSGVLYPQLDRMLQQGWVEDHWESPTDISGKRPPRRYYTLTDDGRAELGAVIRRAQRDPRFGAMRAGLA